MFRKLLDKHYIIFPLFISLLVSAIYVTGLPLRLIQFEVASNNIFYMFNIVLASVLCLVSMKTLYAKWKFGFQFNGVIKI